MAEEMQSRTEMLRRLNVDNRNEARREAIADAAAYLSTVADQLDERAKQSRSGGWSTHQVDANISLANSCRRKAAQLLAHS
jgi:hypothetical protein